MARSTFLPFSPPTLGDEEIAEVVDSLRSGWLSTGPKTKRFEQDFAAYVGARFAVGVNSCTAGLQATLRALDVGDGDEVIVPTYTFCATANVVVHVGATPVLVDVCEDDFNIDPAAIRRAITPRTRAIVPVHFAGQPCRMDEIVAVAREAGVRLVEDAAHAPGARYQDRAIGTIGEATCFSFYATKNMTTGEGGMVTTDDEALARRLEVTTNHGMSRNAWKRYSGQGSWFYEVVEPGYKFNMTDIQAALGIHQLRRLEGFRARRAAVARRYTAAFADLAEVRVPGERPDVTHAWHLYVLRLDLGALAIDRAAFIEELRARNIGASVHFIPVHRHPYYRERFGYAARAFPVADRIYEEAVSLPFHPGLSDADVDDVVGAVREIVTTRRR